jgi:hypothetical protein
MWGIVRSIVGRLKEPSTWAGVSALAILFGAPPGAVDVIGQVVVSLASAASILLPEVGGKNGATGAQ